MKILYIILSLFLCGCEKDSAMWSKVEEKLFVLKFFKTNINLEEKRFIPKINFKEISQVHKNYVYDYDRGFLSSKSWKTKIRLFKRVCIFECGPFVILGDAYSRFLVLQKNDGKIVFEGDCQNLLDKALYLNNKLIICDTTGNISCFNNKFELMWSKKRDSDFGMSNCCNFMNGNLISLSFDGNISAINILNGESIWLHMLSEKVSSFDVINNENNIVLRINNRLIILNKNGQIIYEKRLKGLKQALFDKSRFIYLVVGDEVLVTDISNIQNGKFIKKYNSNDEFYFILRKTLFSLSFNGKLSVYHQYKEVISKLGNVHYYNVFHNYARGPRKNIWL